MHKLTTTIRREPLELHKREAAEQVPHVKTALQRKIEAADRHARGGRAGVCASVAG